MSQGGGWWDTGVAEQAHGGVAQGPLEWWAGGHGLDSSLGEGGKRAPQCASGALTLSCARVLSPTEMPFFG